MERPQAHMKSALAQKMTELLTTAPPVGTTLVAHRLQFLEQIIDSKIHHVSLDLCLKAINHVQKHFPACLQKIDLRMETYMLHLFQLPESASKVNKPSSEFRSHILYKV